MDIIVCMKWTPDTSEADLAVDKKGMDIEKGDLDYDMNEWDRFAIEEAVRIKEKLGGKVTVVSVAPEEVEEVLRESLARGADEAFQLWDDACDGSDGYATAKVLAKFAQGRKFDLILTGTLADDDCAGQVGGMLAAMLGIPGATLVQKLDIADGTMTVLRELEAGLSEKLEIDLPAVVSVATGLNEPRFVSVRAVRKVASAEIPCVDLAALGLAGTDVGDAGARVRIEKVFLPPEGEGAEMIPGKPEEAAARLAAILKEKGGIS
ncbi:MAG: electron transfer flavoprotein subunit beta/FixA family protein [Thermodesulfobacteriota bacterium]